MLYMVEHPPHRSAPIAHDQTNENENEIDHMRKRTLTTRRLVIYILAALIAGAAVVSAGLAGMYRVVYPAQYQTYVEASAKENGVDPALIYAIIKCESSFRADAQSSIGARGLMQLTQDTFDWVKYRMKDTSGTTYDSMFIPETNIRYGTYMIKLMLDEFGDLDTALCAYHAGRGITNEWLQNKEYSPDGLNVTAIPYSDTRAYVARVTRTIKIYKALYKFN